VLLWDLPAGSSCSLNSAAEPEPRYCEPGQVGPGCYVVMLLCYVTPWSTSIFGVC
jgi:hypothetical protein